MPKNKNIVNLLFASKAKKAQEANKGKKRPQKAKKTKQKFNELTLLDKQITGHIEHPRVQQQHRHLRPIEAKRAKKSHQRPNIKIITTYSFGQANNWPH